jgi:hypothetical protein
MTDAPETIRASLTAVRDGWYQLVNVKTGQREFKMTSYTRTDIHDIAQARIAELEAAIVRLLRLNDNLTLGENHHDQIEPAWDAARAALKPKP